MSCDKHNFIYYKTEKFKQDVFYRSTRFYVSEKFVCTSCGETIEKLVRDRTFNQTEMDNLPDWVRANFIQNG